MGPRSPAIRDFGLMKASTERLSIQTGMFEGDVTDESFYRDELSSSRVEAKLESIDARTTVSD
jgi:hypothetical protein